MIDFDFPEAGLSGKAESFTETTFYAYLDDLLRNSDDANDGLLARAVVEPEYAVIEKARQGFPSLAAALADLLCQDAGLTGVEPLKDDVTADTPPNVLRRAGAPLDVVAGLISDATANGYRLKLVTVRAQDQRRSTLFACILRTPEDASLISMRESREKKKSYGRAARGAALASILWSSMKPEEACARYPAIAPLVLAPILIEMGDRSAEARFRRR